LRQRLDGKTEVACIVNSRLSFDGILEYVLEDFGINKNGASQAQRLIALHTFLIEQRRANQNSVLILDEAQHLDPSTLEEVRLLSNFETPTEKLLQILLVGQPELKEKLQRPELRQLKQRIGLRCHIPPLTPEEIPEYIRHRLRISGARDLGLFSDRAVRRIAEYSGGIPRLINIVCDHCLLIGYADQKRKIDQDIVRQAIAYLEDGAQPRRAPGLPRGQQRIAPRWVYLAIAATGLGGLLLWIFFPAEHGAWVPRLVGQLAALMSSTGDFFAPFLRALYVMLQDRLA
jgi:general secretion pathway protein A